jgi:hypothetical protein
MCLYIINYSVVSFPINQSRFHELIGIVSTVLNEDIILEKETLAHFGIRHTGHLFN